VDTDHQTEEAWVLGVQRKLYQQSKAHPDEVWRDLWGWLTDLRMIRHSWRRVASNKGKRSPGIDGITVKHIQQRGEKLEELEIKTVWDLRGLDRSSLEQQFGRFGLRLHQLARGIDPSEVVPDRPTKSG